MSHLDLESCPLSPAPFRNALKRILRPLVRTMIARGWLYPDLGDLLKELYVEVSADHFALEGKRLTDSRISLLTGLQRKDIKSIREKLSRTDATGQPQGAGPLARVIGHWLAGPPYCDSTGKANELARLSDGGEPSFETLVADVSRDVHARTILDELKRLDLVRHDPDADSITLLSEAYMPSVDEAGLLGYFGANLGDHAEVAAANLEAAPAPGPNFERAVHYNQLTPDSLDVLEKLARGIQSKALADLNTRALELQKEDAGKAEATGRFRTGAYIFRTRDDETEGPR